MSMYTDNVSWKMNDLVQIRCHSEKKKYKKRQCSNKTTKKKQWFHNIENLSDDIH